MAEDHSRVALCVCFKVDVGTDATVGEGGGGGEGRGGGEAGGVAMVL